MSKSVMKWGAQYAAQAFLVSAPLVLVLLVLYITGVLPQPVPAILTALASALVLEPVRSTLARTALADQQRVLFCAQAMISLEDVSGLVRDVVLNYHPNWNPRLKDVERQRALEAANRLVPVIGLAKMWAPETAAGPLEDLASEIRDAVEFGTKKVDYPTEAYVSLQKALTDAIAAVKQLRSVLPS